MGMREEPTWHHVAPRERPPRIAAAVHLHAMPPVLPLADATRGRWLLENGSRQLHPASYLNCSIPAGQRKARETITGRQMDLVSEYLSDKQSIASIQTTGNAS